jgi:hypothetical protein
MTKENVIPMQFLSASCLQSCNFPKDKRSKWNLGWGLSLTPLHCPNQVSRIRTPCPPGKNQVSLRHGDPLLGHLGWNFQIPFSLGRLGWIFEFPMFLGQPSFGPQFLGNCVFAKANGWLPKEIGTSKSLSSPHKTTWLDISSLFVLSWSNFGPKFWGNQVFPRANGWFHEVLGPKTWSPRSKGLEIFKQVALERKALGNPNQVAPRISGWCWAATPDPMLSATGSHTLPLLQNFNLWISCVWSRFRWVVFVLCGSNFFYWWNYIKFWPGEYDFDLVLCFLHGEYVINSSNFEGKNFQNTYWIESWINPNLVNAWSINHSMTTGRWISPGN